MGHRDRIDLIFFGNFKKNLFYDRKQKVWARIKSELGEHLVTQTINSVWHKIMIVRMITDSKLLSSFSRSAIYSFSNIYATDRHRKAVVTLKISNSDLDWLGATYFLTHRDPCLGCQPYFRNHCWNRLLFWSNKSRDKFLLSRNGCTRFMTYDKNNRWGQATLDSTQNVWRIRHNILLNNALRTAHVAADTAITSRPRKSLADVPKPSIVRKQSCDHFKSRRFRFCKISCFIFLQGLDYFWLGQLIWKRTSWPRTPKSH